MQSGDCWQSVCVHCGKRAHLEERWQLEKPDDTAPHAKSCCEAVSGGGAAPLAAWEHCYVKPLGYMRQSGFSTSESDFTPHWNRAFGKPVHSLAEMKSLQEKHGVNDVVVKGDGAERHAPRDVLRRVKQHNDTREKLASTDGFEVARGVKVKLSSATEAD